MPRTQTVTFRIMALHLKMPLPPSRFKPSAARFTCTADYALVGRVIAEKHRRRVEGL